MTYKTVWPDGTALHSTHPCERYAVIYNAIDRALYEHTGIIDKPLRACKPGQYIAYWRQISGDHLTTHIAVVDEPQEARQFNSKVEIVIVGPRPTDEEISAFDNTADVLPEWLWSTLVKERLVAAGKETA